MTAAKLDIGKMFTDTFALVKARPVWVLIWGALLVVLPALPAIPLLMWMAENTEVWTNSPEAIEEMTVLNALANFSSLIQLLLAIPVIAATARFILGKQGSSRFAGLRFSMDELWVFVIMIAYYVVSFLAVLVVVLVAAIPGVIVGLATSNSGLGVLVGVVIGIGLCLPLIWASVRLSLLIGASIDNGTFDLVNAWKASRGQFWPLLGSILVLIAINIGLFILWVIVAAVACLIVFAIGTMTGMTPVLEDPATWNVVPMAIMAGVLMIIPSSWVSGLMYVSYTAPFVSAWMQLKPSVQAPAAVIADPVQA